MQSVALPSSRSWQAGLPGRSSIVELVAEQLMERQIPIASAIETLAKRLGATNEQAWAEIKSSAFYGRLSLAGIDDKGRLCDLEPHWIRYISPWGVEDPSPDGGSTAGATTSDMPRHGDFIAFDRERVIRHWRADKREGRTPRSIPPIRMRDVVADAAELDVRWMRAEYEFQSLDWSLGNALSWIAYRDALLICAFETQRDLARKRFYSFPRSDVPRRGMVLPMAGSIFARRAERRHDNRYPKWGQRSYHLLVRQAVSRPRCEPALPTRRGNPVLASARGGGRNDASRAADVKT